MEIADAHPDRGGTNEGIHRGPREAALKLDKATMILRRYQDELAAATARREQAEAALDHSAERCVVLDKTRDDAVAAVTNTGRIPLSGETVTLSGLHLIMSQELDEVELLLAGQTARLVCAATGVTSDIENEITRQVPAEKEDAAKGKPLHLRQSRDGVTAIDRYPVQHGLDRPAAGTFPAASLAVPRANTFSRGAYRQLSRPRDT